MTRKYFSFGILVILTASLFLAFPFIRKNFEKDKDFVSLQKELEHLHDSLFFKVHMPEMVYGFKKDSVEVIESRVKRNQNLAGILSEYDVDPLDLHELSIVSREVFDVRKIQANKKISIITGASADSVKRVKALVYESSPEEMVIFNLADSIYVQTRKKEVQFRERQIAGVIQSSLALTMDELGMSPQLTNDFADIFAWQIDFFHLYPGDRFKVIFEEKVVEDEVIGIGKIVAAEFEHNGNPFYALMYDQGNGLDYFDEDGNSLRKALLRYPVKFSRISSRYSGRRFHPVQKRYKAHRGTDFAAPRGTPIRTVGDGIVLEARYGKFNGNYVKVKHNGNYTTGYLHMTKIASGVRPGKKVKQGQIIGYVGSTGLARGNHVCFRFWKNGVQVDALKVDLPPSEPIKEENLDEYNRTKDVLLQRLIDISYPTEETMLAGLDG